MMWVMTFFREMIINSPVNKADKATIKNIFRKLTTSTTLDKMNEKKMMQVMITTDMKSGTKGSASRKILFFL